jgi:hypothetical protein
MQHLDLHRRRFLGTITLSIGGAAAGTLLPVSLLRAAPAACLVDASRHADPCGDWQLDDICNAYPPYSLHVNAPVPAAEIPGAAAHPADSHWIA